MRIIHLFADLCNLYGDYGNVCALKRALENKGQNVEIEYQSIDDAIDISGADFVFIGSATERNQKVALDYLQSYKDNIKTALDNGTVILATGNSFEMFGQSVTDCDGTKHEGLSFFPYETIEGKERIVTDSLCDTSLCGGDIIGFVNKASLTTGATSPLFDVKQGSGNGKDDSQEGVHYGNFYGTHLIGPVLIRNPQLCEYFADILIKKQ
ncbi:Predicted glutamine amidotransferase [[Eubacterium] siraeum V10Sc8a]|uniref:Predicted glutamine amidotransferase n=1 Tax=[Eubacterium] siraeum V10Sc8a TaxID=717961 RepID=D4MMN4_9FIRM|nr:Predicted glutamine amidotransferase [[Eubacterium] siraeum V10Sc8a]